MDIFDEKKLVIAKKIFNPGDILCKEGEKCPNLYLLLQGAVEITVSGKVVQIIDKEGTFIGDFNPLINHEGATSPNCNPGNRMYRGSFIPFGGSDSTETGGRDQPSGDSCRTTPPGKVTISANFKIN